MANNNPNPPRAFRASAGDGYAQQSARMGRCQRRKAIRITGLRTLDSAPQIGNTSQPKERVK